MSALSGATERNISDAELTSADDVRRGPRGLVLAFADELLVNPDLYWRTRAVAIAAFLAGDHALFERTLPILGRHVSDLDGLAHQLVAAKEYTRGIAVYRAIVAHEGAPLSAWNNLAHALSLVPELPPDAADLLTRADAHGMANSYIFHNTACTWVRLGNHDRAIEAIRGAVRAGYPLLERLRGDTDLAPLFDDPRFAGAFAAPVNVSFDELVVTKSYSKKTFVVQRPVLVFDFFLAPITPNKLGAQVADLVEAYLSDIPPGSLTMARRNGPWKLLAKAARTKELAKLRAARKDSFIDVQWRGDTDTGGGAPTEYGLHVDIWGDSKDFGEHDRVPVISMWFPAELARDDVDAIAARFERYAAMVPVEAGGAGLRVMLRHSDYVEVWWESHMLEEQLSRFFGSEPHPWREWKAGHAAGAMWLTLLSTPLAAKLGGVAALREAVAPALVHELPDAVVVRASLRPALGVGPTPTDLGLLPKVARAIEPLYLTEAKAHEDPAPHYRRLFGIADGAYDNGPPVAPNASLRGLGVPEPSRAKKPATKKPATKKPATKKPAAKNRAR